MPNDVNEAQLPPPPAPEHWYYCCGEAKPTDGYTLEQLYDYAHAALASKPAAREAARQSIDTAEFRRLIAHVQGFDDGEPIFGESERALIAYIDTWGGAAPAAGNTTQTAYVPLHVLEALRAGCKVATTLTPGKDDTHTEAVQLLPNNH